MSKQTLVAVIIIGALSGGVGWLARSQIPPKTPAQLETDTLAQEDTVKRSRYQNLEAKLDATVARVEKLHAENDRLAQKLREQKAIVARAAERSEVTAPEDLAPADHRINWKRLSTVLAAWLQVRDAVARDGNRRLTQSEQAQRAEMMALLSRTAEKAHEISDHPIFDDEIFPDLAVALFTPFLALNEVQVAQIEERARQLVRDAAAALDPAGALPVERVEVRQNLVGRLLDAAQEILEPDQQSKWPQTADALSNLLAGEQRRVETGIAEWDDDRLAEFITGEWQRAFTVSADQSPHLREYALDYARGVRDLLAAYGQTPDSSHPLTEDSQKAYERAMLDLQISIESRVVSILGEKQVAALADAVPVLLIFNYGRDQNISERYIPSF